MIEKTLRIDPKSPKIIFEFDFFFNFFCRDTEFMKAPHFTGEMKIF
tara:strand:- start:204131 stop:204268 length:138 start_codon:yes stop_codon:yes gene_type:complete